MLKLGIGMPTAVVNHLPPEREVMMHSENGVIGARQTWVMMEHNTKTGEPKLVPECSYPLTCLACVSRVYTDLAVLAITPAGLRLLEVVPGLDFDVLQARTGVPLLR